MFIKCYPRIYSMKDLAKDRTQGDDPCSSKWFNSLNFLQLSVKTSCCLSFLKPRNIFRCDGSSSLLPPGSSGGEKLVQSVGGDKPEGGDR